jgi:hypothetical protein
MRSPVLDDDEDDCKSESSMSFQLTCAPKERFQRNRNSESSIEGMIFGIQTGMVLHLFVDCNINLTIFMIDHG